MKISHLALALCLGTSTIAVAAGKDAEPTKSQRDALVKCEGLTGAALDKCKREAAPGKSEDAASRAGGATPGASGDATSRTGTPPSNKNEATPNKKGAAAQR